MGRTYLGKRPVQSGLGKNYASTPSTSTTLSPSGGVYYLSSTSALKTWSLRAPLASEVGQVVELHCIKATTSLLCRVTLASASMFSTVSSTGVTKDAIRFNRADQALVLRAYSTAKYKVVNNLNSVTITTS